MEIILSKQASKYYQKAPTQLQTKFDKAFENILKGEGDIVVMKGEPGFFRMRVGDFTIIFSLTTNAVVIEKIGPRGDIYKK